jgi:hypothetical protein
MTQQIVVSRRDGILRAPDGTRHRVARGKTLAHADHPAVLANPRDWVPMVIDLAIDGRPDGAPGAGIDTPLGVQHEEIVRLENDVAELEETLASRDAELTRLVEGLAELGVALPTEDDREPGWLVDRVLAALGPVDLRDESAEPEPAAQIAPPKPRKRTAPPLTTRTGDDG